MSFFTFCDGSRVEKEYYPNGKIKSISNVVGGMRMGERICYDSMGNLASRSSFLNDSLVGPYIEYYPNGELKKKGNYRSGKLNGEYLTFYPNGNIESRTIFVEDVHTGSYYQYYPEDSGKILFDSYFVKVGEKPMRYYLKKFDRNGRLIESKQYVKIGFSNQNKTLLANFRIVAKGTEYDSALIMTGMYDQDFKVDGTIDTLRVHPQEGSVDYAIDQQLAQHRFLRGQMVVFKSESYADSTITYESYSYFEERIPQR